jgi:hypothetical protein
MPTQRAEVEPGSGMSNDDSSIGLECAAKTAYMRKWRAGKINQMRERNRRTAAYRERKSQSRRKPQGDSTADPIRQMCAICRMRRSVEQVSRLRLCKSSPSGFEEVLIPYCGKC